MEQIFLQDNQPPPKHTHNSLEDARTIWTLNFSILALVIVIFYFIGNDHPMAYLLYNTPVMIVIGTFGIMSLIITIVDTTLLNRLASAVIHTDGVTTNVALYCIWMLIVIGLHFTAEKNIVSKEINEDLQSVAKFPCYTGFFKRETVQELFDMRDFGYRCLVQSRELIATSRVWWLRPAADVFIGSLHMIWTLFFLFVVFFYIIYSICLAIMTVLFNTPFIIAHLIDSSNTLTAEKLAEIYFCSKSFL